MHRGKSRRKRKTHKVCKQTHKLAENRGKFVKVGGKNIFFEIGGKCIEIAKIGGNSKFFVAD